MSARTDLCGILSDWYPYGDCLHGRGWQSEAMTIRPLCHDDVDALIEMSARMHEKSAYSFLPCDRQKVGRLIVAYVDHPETYGGFVAETAGELAGMIGGYVSDYFFCDETVAWDM